MKSHSLFSFAAALLSAVLITPIATVAKDQSASAPVNLRVELDRTTLPAGSTERAIVKIAFDTPRRPRPEARPPVNLSLVLDRSGSMSGEKIQQAKNAAIEAVRRLAADDIFSLVAFDNNVDTLIPAARVGSGRELEARIRAIQPGGGTAIYAGVTQGASELRKHSEDRRYVHRLILLSDGLANVGPSSPDELGRLGSALVQEGISVTTVGVGLGYNEDLMARLADRSDGNTYFVASSNDLPRIFNAELGDVLNVVARGIVLTIEFPEGVRPLSFIGREGVIRGQTGELSLNQLYGGQEKFALVEVEVASARAGEKRDVAKASLSFEDPLTQRRQTTRALGSVSFSANQREVVASANAKVQADYAINVTAQAKDSAIGFVDANRRDEAAKQLRERNAELKKMATTYNNPAVASLVESNAKEADRLEREGLDNVARKSYRAENAQTRSQQSSSTGSR